MMDGGRCVWLWMGWNMGHACLLDLDKVCLALGIVYWEVGDGLDGPLLRTGIQVVAEKAVLL